MRVQRIRYIIIGILLSTGMSLWAQEEEKKERIVVQISGLVLNNENLEPVPYTNIGVKGSYRGTSADANGFFSIVTYAGDELMFTSIGFRSVSVKIPDTITANRYTLYQSLMQDTLELPLTVIYPWPSKEKFKEAFLNLNIPDDDYEIARKNLALSELKDRAKYTGMTASMNYRNYINQKTDQLYYGGALSGQKPANNLLNPFAWAQFMRIWNEQKEAKRKKKVLDWESV